MAYAYVLLDADDTLFDFVKAERHCIHGVLERCGAASPQAEQLFVSINQGLWRRLERGEVSAERLRVLRFEELFAKLGVSLPPQEGAALYLQFLAESCFLLPEALAVVQTLARRRIPVAVVTNGFSYVQHRRLQLSGLLPYLDAVVVSQDLGLQKPNPALVDLALDRLGCRDRTKALLVGDSLSSDMAAAANAGVCGVWYNPRRKPRPQGQPFYEITRLSTLLHLVNHP